MNKRIILLRSTREGASVTDIGSKLYIVIFPVKIALRMKQKREQEHSKIRMQAKRFLGSKSQYVKLHFREKSFVFFLRLELYAISPYLIKLPVSI